MTRTGPASLLDDAGAEARSSAIATLAGTATGRHQRVASRYCSCGWRSLHSIDVARQHRLHAIGHALQAAAAENA